MHYSREFVDLHCHSTASDGTLEPARVVVQAVASGLSALSLTDHDTIAGIEPARAEAARLGLDFLPGIEISAQFPHPGTLHLLGYGVDPNSACLTEMTRTLRAGRDDRNPKIVNRLRELNVDISMDEVENQAGGEVIGRPHIAAILVRKGYVSSIKQAFDKYLAPGGLAYFDKERLEPRRAIEMIVESGGIPVLAHPVQLATQNDAELERIIKYLMDLGLAGLEVIHSDHTPELVAKYEALADRLGLLKTGGSDFHGDNKSGIVLGRAGTRGIPRAYYDKLLEMVSTKIAKTAQS